jgi:hypothetical protein
LALASGPISPGAERLWEDGQGGILSFWRDLARFGPVFTVFDADFGLLPSMSYAYLDVNNFGERA